MRGKENLPALKIFIKGIFSDEESPFLLKEFETFAIYVYFLNI